MRIVSLLPSATDIVAALGAGDALVGVSHSCDSQWSNLPALTRTWIDVDAPAGEIDRVVRTASDPLYSLDIALLDSLAPDVVISQSLCDVCAVPSGDVLAAVQGLAKPPQLIDLAPFRLDDIPAGFVQVGDAIGAGRAALELCGRWEAALDRARGRFARDNPLRIGFLDWVEPPFAAGHWVPDLIELIGCESVLARAGEPSRQIGWDDVRHAGADLLIAACCGQTADRARSQPVPADLRLVWLDGYQQFSRPGPAILDSLATLIHTVGEHLQNDRADH